jgi:hypothetical protein
MLAKGDCLKVPRKMDKRFQDWRKVKEDIVHFRAENK